MNAVSWKLLSAGILAVCALGLAWIAPPICAAAGLVWPPIAEPPSSRHAPGKWVWTELFTEDVAAAVRFYGEAFGWSFQAFPASRGTGYTLALADGEPVGGMLQRGHEYQQQRGSRWLGMISVVDVAAAARYAMARAAAGGSVVGRGEVALRRSGGRAVRRDPLVQR
jgi:predicted enzyme related to lactoylglutathione lyase